MMSYRDIARPSLDLVDAMLARLTSALKERRANVLGESGSSNATYEAQGLCQAIGAVLEGVDGKRPAL